MSLLKQTDRMDEELLVCSVCKLQFDSDERKPKFLPCRHHTLCCKCLDRIVDTTGTIKCPVCYRVHDVRAVPLSNNSYILYILKLKSKLESDASRITSQSGPSWCLTCDSMAHSECAQCDHGLLHLTSSTIKNLERLVCLKNEFKSMKDRLMLAIEKRKEIQVHFIELLDAVKSVQHDILIEMEENDQQLVDWTDLLEKNSLADEPPPVTGVALDLDEYFLSELLTFVGQSKPEGTLEMLKKKVEETALDYSQKLDDISAVASEIEEQRKMRISVRMSDPSRNDDVVPIGDVLCDGFIAEGLAENKTLGPIDKSLLLLLSHIIFTLHKHRHNKRTNPPRTNGNRPNVR